MDTKVDLFSGRVPAGWNATFNPGRGSRGGYHDFLRRDTGNQVYLDRCRVTRRGELYLVTRLADGRNTHTICGFMGKSALDVAVREEQGKGSGRVKVLYGWDVDSPHFGKFRQAILKCVVSEKKPGETDWQPLRKPRQLSLLTPNQQAHHDRAALESAMEEGLGRRKLSFWWKVDAKKGTMKFEFGGESYTVWGFSGFNRVYVVVREEQNAIVGYVYRNDDDARAETGLWQKIEFSRKRRNGKQLWLPVLPPKVLFCSASENPRGIHFRRRVIAEIVDFLTHDQAEGQHIDLPPIRPQPNGCFYFLLHGKRLWFSGYPCAELGNESVAFDGFLYGRIIQRGTQKRAYFWASPVSRQAGAPFLRMDKYPEGHLVAERKGEQWEVCYQSEAPEQRDQLRATLQLGRLLAGCLGDEVVIDCWPVRTVPGKVMKAKRNLWGGPLRLSVPRAVAEQVTDGELAAVVREVANHGTLIEFFPSRRAVRSGGVPFTARILTVLTAAGQREILWARLDDQEKFRAWVASGAGYYDIVAQIFADPYLAEHYPQTWVEGFVSGSQPV